ncbi:MAG: methyltransferase domain-containing protein [Deltaproteobacteria bacterium]|jgi:phospholipid N-methyltransferase|nr:methyltransferase domain-containing protein [Deltaproteobacteria bacterium]
MTAEKLLESLNFAGNFTKFPKEVGAILPSSSFASLAMLQGIDWHNLKSIAEYGCGTGAFTRDIALRMHSQTKLIGIEINKNFYQKLKNEFDVSPDFQRVNLYHDSVENIGQICEKENIRYLDCVVSGLPWTFFSKELQTNILQKTLEVMHSESRFIAIAYLHGIITPASKHFIRLLRTYFKNVEFSKIVWRNVPPARVITCKNPKTFN